MSISPDAILDIFETETGLPRDKLRPEATLAELDIASLDLVSISFEVEDKLGVEIRTDDLKPDMTVGALIEQIQLLRSA